MKLLQKLLLVSSSFLLTTNILNAKTTICYKNNWNSPSTIESIALDGGECNGKLSIKDMEQNGWKVLDIKIESNQNKLSYSYLLTDSNTVIKEVKKINQPSLDKKFSFDEIKLKLENINNKQSTINIGNLTVGQSGIVTHNYENNKSIIVANAKVISSNANKSVVQFSKYKDLTQNAIPNTNRQVKANDTLILNYLYHSSLLLAPTQDTFQIVKSNFKKHNFLHSDIFAAQLINERITNPTKKDIQNFAMKQNLGTIFIVLDQKIYVVDTKTFSILNEYNFKYSVDDLQLPFYTRLEKDESSGTIFDFDIFSLYGNVTYNRYYKTILGLK